MEAVKAKALPLFDEFALSPESLLQEMNRQGVSILHANEVTNKFIASMGTDVKAFTLMPDTLQFTPEPNVDIAERSLKNFRESIPSFAQNIPNGYLQTWMASFENWRRSLEHNHTLGMYLNINEAPRTLLLHETFHILQASEGLPLGPTNYEVAQKMGRLKKKLMLWPLINTISALTYAVLTIVTLKALKGAHLKKFIINHTKTYFSLVLLPAVGILISSPIVLGKLLNGLAKRGWIQENPNSPGYQLRHTNLKREFEVSEFMKSHAEDFGISKQEQKKYIQGPEKFYRMLYGLSYLSDLFGK